MSCPPGLRVRPDSWRIFFWSFLLKRSSTKLENCMSVEFFLRGRCRQLLMQIGHCVFFFALAAIFFEMSMPMQVVSGLCFFV